MITTPVFEEAYRKLNAKQKEAVDALYGPVLVIAGPGTGKTQVLALRIGNILLKATGAKPDEILALTFTDGAAAALRARLVHFIGTAAYRVRINTFHGFARSILELRPDLFPRVALGTHLSPVRGIALMEKLLDEGSYAKIRNPKDPYRAAKSLFAFMAKLKQEHYTPERYLSDLTREHESVLADPDRIHAAGQYAGREKGEHARRRERIEKHIEVARLFSAYEMALERESLYDYEDLISEAIRGLETDEEFRSYVGERSQFVLADEHQDANPAQNRLLELVTDFDGAPNLFIVGDEKQAIYRFQGASLASFFYFKEKYPDAKVISLNENYRSTAGILAAAHDLIAPAPIPDPALRPMLHAARGEGGTIEEVECSTPREELEAIGSHISQLHASGTPYDAIAVLTKKNADVLALADALRAAGIPEDHASAEMDALSHPATLLFIELIRAVARSLEDAPLARALFMPGMPGTLKERMRLLALPRRDRPLAEVLAEKGNKEMRSWIRDMKGIAEETPATPLVPLLVRLARVSGFEKGLLSLAESEDAYEAYQGLMNEAAVLAKEDPSATALHFLEHIERIEKHSLDVKRPRTRHSGVRLMTAHAAKGLEFPHVIIAHATDEKWLRGRTDEFSLLLEKEDDEHDIRRLLYVALTRAQDSVLIIHSKMTEENRVQTPLRFLADIAPHLNSRNFSPAQSLVPARYETRAILDPEFVRERFLARGFSPTGFNNYKASPWQYYFRTLINLPDTPSLPALFGTAIHSSLKAYTDKAKAGGALAEDAISAFRSEIAGMPLSPSEKDDLIKTGVSALTAYLLKHGHSFGETRESELSITVPFGVPGVGEFPLTGKIDRIDANADGRTVTVVDYKTGSARSVNEIKGLTKKSTGDYYRQLVFYKLLLERDGRYVMNEAELHFVEPDEKGDIITRRFLITEAEVADLETELADAARSIVQGSAFTASCDPAACDYCDLVGYIVSEA